MSNMAAAVVRELGRVECDIVAAPEPEAGRVLVRTSLASICGSDLHIAYQGWGVTGLPMPPGRPGHEGVGEVVDGGGTGFEPGQVVLTVPNIHDSATFAEYQLLRPGNLLTLPDTKPLTHLLMAQQLGTVIFGCRLLPPLRGKTVAVIGQGSVGLFHDFILRRLGAERIIGVDPVPARLQAARNMGVDEAVSETGPAATEAILDLTDGEGAGVVIDAVGSVETLNQSLAVAAKWGRVAAFGLPTTADTGAIRLGVSVPQEPHHARHTRGPGCAGPARVQGRGRPHLEWGDRHVPLRHPLLPHQPGRQRLRPGRLEIGRRAQGLPYL